MKKRLRLNKVTIKDLDELALQNIAGGATVVSRIESVCLNNCMVTYWPGCTNGGTCGTCNQTCGDTCGDSCGCPVITDVCTIWGQPGCFC